MSPTEQLKEEHEGTKVILDILAKVFDRLESGARVDQRHPENIQQALLAGFDKVEEERVDRGKHEEFHRLMDRLHEERAGPIVTGFPRRGSSQCPRR